MKIEGERSLEITAPPRLVWSLVADITAMGRWSPITRSAAWIPPAEGPAEGARFTGTNRLPLVRRWTSTATITRCIPGYAFDFAVGRHAHDPNTVWSYRFEPTPTGGTMVTERWKMLHEPAIVRAYYRVVGQAARIAIGVEETLRSLKTAAEAAHRSEPDAPPGSTESPVTR